MHIAVISDVHGNLEALDAVLDDIKEKNVSQIFSLGDNIGYGADPEAVMERLKKPGVLSVLGNHEMAVKKESFISWFNPTAKKAVEYTIQNLSEASAAEISAYPKCIVMDNLRFVHGAPPASPFIYLFQLSDEKLEKCMKLYKETVCFVGHTHDLQIIECRENHIERQQLAIGETKLDENSRYIINAGSVGQPRDRDKRAKYLIYDSDLHQITVHAVEYDAQKAADKIIKAGIPADYATRLL